MRDSLLMGLKGHGGALARWTYDVEEQYSRCGTRSAQAHLTPIPVLCPQWYNGPMHPPSPRPKPFGPSFLAWLTYNASGIPRRHALRVVASGVVLGVLVGVVAGGLARAWQTTTLGSLVLGAGSGAIGGATVGALAVVLAAGLLDWALPSSDRLVGYSGLVRMLLQAGELSFLGGIGGGIGGASGGVLIGALMGSLIGSLLYRVRGLGTLLGLVIGALMGALGGAIGGAIGRLGG
jgi:hypothetical protein